jgi:signal transduction histidine kinase
MDSLDAIDPTDGSTDRFRAVQGQQQSGQSSGGERRPGRVARRVRRALAALGGIFTAPFYSDAEQAVRLSTGELDQRRRGAILRLILVCVAAVDVFLLLPSTLLGQATAADLWRLGLVTALALVCLLLNQVGRTTIAGILFIYGTLGLVLDFILGSAGELTQPVLLTFALMALLILMVGLILPAWVTWLTTALIVGGTVAGVFLIPLPVAVLATAGDPAALRLGAAGPLVALQIFVAVFSWVAARSASAGTRAARAALARERELTALKDQFIIDANHELRTPIMALYGNVELLRALGERATPEERARLLDRALASGEAVLRLLSSVLDAGLLESAAPQVEIKPVVVHPLVLAVLETFDPREIGEPGLEDTGAAPRTVSVQVPASLVVLADELRLRQILINLLSNALKYSPPNSPLTVSAQVVPTAQPSRRPTSGPHRAQEPDGFVQISVRDAGLGIPPDDAPKLFSRFVRLERDIAGPVRGTGVGLFVCRTLVEAMGGRIWVESSGVPGAGSIFSFTLPAAPTTPDAPATAPREPAQALAASGQ